MLTIALLACRDEPEPSSPATNDETGLEIPTGETATEPPAFDARCELTVDNALRAYCTATLPADGSMRFEIWDVSKPETLYPYPSDEAGTEHQVFVWALLPSSSYGWRAIDETTGLTVEGVFQTSPLPTDISDLSVSISESSSPALSGVDLLLVAPGCPGGMFVMFDAFGQLVWYQRLSDLDPTLVGAITVTAYTEDDTLLAVVGRSIIIEFDLAGNLLWKSSREVDFPHFVHHEIFKRGGYTYAIYSHTVDDSGTNVIADGVYVLDSAGALADEFSVYGLWPLVVQPIMLGGYWSGIFPDAVDFSHTNSIYVEENGDIWLSFRHLSAFGKFSGLQDPGGLGELKWIAVGTSTSPIAGAGSFSLAGLDPTFEGQHDVHPSADGSVLMLDNGLALGSLARGARYLLDEQSQTLTAVESWPLGLFCPVQGSVRELPSGNVLVTCASASLTREYDPYGNIVWEATPICRDTVPAGTARGIPVSRYRRP